MGKRIMVVDDLRGIQLQMQAVLERPLKSTTKSVRIL